MMDVCALFRALPPTYKIILEFSMVSAMFFFCTGWLLRSIYLQHQPYITWDRIMSSELGLLPQFRPSSFFLPSKHNWVWSGNFLIDRSYCIEFFKSTSFKYGCELT
jgi:hypothetical protein